MALEAIYVGPETTKIEAGKKVTVQSTMRVNNGEKNYQKFLSGEPQDVDEEMAAILRGFDYFIVREKEEKAPTTKKTTAAKKK